MKIGILTFHRTENYGSILQCFALQEVLKSLGHEVEIIDYFQTFRELRVKPNILKKIKNGLKYVFKPKEFIFRYKKGASLSLRYKHVQVFTEQYISLSRKVVDFKENLGYDTIIIGSDQMWSLTSTGNQIEPIYFGFIPNIANCCGIYTYAVSSNKYSIEKLEKIFLEKIISNFKGISFRELYIKDLVSQKIGRDIGRVDLDPVLLAGKQFWSRYVENSKWQDKKYIISYEARPNYENPFLIKRMAKQFAGKMRSEYIDVADGSYSVVDFISMINNAQYVLTTSFHGLAFSIMFNTPFYYIILNDGHDSRAIDLLNRLGLRDLAVEYRSDVKPMKIDWSYSNAKLDELQSESMDFLKNI